jgi:dGTPase
MSAEPRAEAPAAGHQRRPRLRTQLAQVRAALTKPNLARLMGVWGAWVTAEWVLLIATSVLAYEVGGAAAVGLVGAARVLPGAVLASIASIATDRYPRPRVLAVTQVLMALVSGAILWSAASGAGQAVLVLAIGVSSVVLTVVRTTVTSMVPQVVRTPQELIVANSAMSTVEGAGTVLGPVLSGLLIAVGGPTAALVVPVVVFVAGFFLARAIRTPFQPPRLVNNHPWRRALEPLQGFPELLRPRARVVTGLFMMQATMRGLLNVFVVVIAITLLGSESQTGTLFAAMGVGGVIGSLAVLGAGPSRAPRWFAFGIVMWGLPVVAMGLWPQLIVVWAALALVGLGNACGDIFGYTLLNRLFRDHVAGRAWGAFNSAADGAIAIGSVLAPVLIAAWDLTPAMVVSGLVLAVAPVLAWPFLRSMEREADTHAVRTELLAEVELFEPLPPLVLERLARASGERQLTAGEYAVREGEPGDFYYVVASGTLTVEQRGRGIRTLVPGDAFGEIALLEPVPRTASVRADDAATLLAIDRSAFLAGVTGHVDADRTARALVAELLSGDLVRAMQLEETPAPVPATSGPAGAPAVPTATASGDHPTYTDHDRERWVREDPALKRSDRHDFARDRARVVHSAALRRLSSTTQVVQPDTDDFVRNRLTHSLEVAQIGREFGAALGCDADVVDTACLAHDLGHPPFGHNGEAVLDELAAGIGGFEGNAQTLRVLTRLEAKRSHPDGRPAGLNLTRASLDAATKYPWARGEAPDGGGKFGYYADDAEVFAWLRAGAPADEPRRRCIEADVMDWSDDVAYCVHDVEDGIASGRIDPRALRSRPEQEQVLRIAHDWYARDLSADQLGAAFERLLALGWIPGSHDGSRASLAALKDMTSRLIGRFVHTVELATRERHGQGPLTRYAAWLVVPDDLRAEASVLKAVAAHFVMLTDERRIRMDQERTVVAELVDHFRSHPEAMDPMHRQARAEAERAGDDAAVFRSVIDQVASLSDARALTIHAGLRRG